MSKSTYWQRSHVAFDPQWVADALRHFRREDLADPVSARRWVEFAKNFSQMDLTASDVEQLGF
jgi:predicted ATP-dependent Lon-type protease